jgi:hypothetical protein
MPTLNLSSAFLLGLCVDNGRILKDSEFYNIYGLPEDVFNQDDIKGVKAQNVQALKGFFIAALGQAEGEDRAAFISGKIGKKLAQGNNYNGGRLAYRSWFKALRLGTKINNLVENALNDCEAHPKRLLADHPSIDTGDDAFPDLKSIHSTIQKPVYQAVFGLNALTSVIVPAGAIISVNALLHHTWERLRKERKRAKLTKDSAKKMVQDIMARKQATIIHLPGYKLKFTRARKQ